MTLLNHQVKKELKDKELEKDELERLKGINHKIRNSSEANKIADGIVETFDTHNKK